MLILQKIERILLASHSPRRRELLASLGAEVSVVPNPYHEPPIPEVLPIELALRHARAKILASITEAIPERTLGVAADTVVDVDGTAFGKPRNDLDAKRMLTILSGREHVVHTAFAVALPNADSSGIWKDSDAPPIEPVVKVESTRVRFHELTLNEIDEYVATGEPIDKAGAYGIQGLASALVDGIDGDFYTVMGFPLGRFIRTMRELGFVFR